MLSFIDEHRALYEVEPIYGLLPIAPSTYYQHEAREVIRHGPRYGIRGTKRLCCISSGSGRKNFGCITPARYGGG
jgi:hypothetical protein